MSYTEIKITKAKVLKPFLIEVIFNDKKVKRIDLEPVLYGSVYEPLRNPKLFKEMRVNEEVQTIEWSNGADFHPETLYNWDEYKDEMIENAKKWGNR